jgi:hypothetical protein
MAPGAELYCIRVMDEVDLENASDTIKARGIQVVNISMGWPATSYGDGTGPYDSILTRSRQNDGVFWVSAAGNYAESHWRGIWSDTDGDRWLNFSGDDELMQFDSAGTIYLIWDQFDAAVTDLDLYILDKDYNVADSSILNQSGGPDQSYEAVTLDYDYGLEPYHIAIYRRSGSAAGLDLSVFLDKGYIREYLVPASSMLEPGTSHGAFTVGSIVYYNYNQESPPIQPFSSQGPTVDGRIKPDIAAPDGCDNFTLSHYTGTSFAAPVAAGAAALLLEKYPSLTADQLDSALQDLAQDLDPPGKDNVFGAGRLRLENFPPEFNPASDQSIREGRHLIFTVFSSDPNDYDSLVITAADLPAGALFQDSGNGNGSFIWTPDTSQAGIYQIIFSVSDGLLIAHDTIEITVDNADPPVIQSQAQTLTTPEDSSLTITLTAVNVTDVSHPSGPFTLLVLQDSNYTVEGTTITPDLNYHGDLRVPARVSDPIDTSSVFNLTVTVLPVNDIPVIVGQDSIILPEEGMFVVYMESLTIVDSDNNFPDHFTMQIEPVPFYYTVKGDTIFLEKDHTGLIWIPITVFDGTDYSPRFGLQVRITPINDPPFITSLLPTSDTAVSETDSILFTVNASDIEQGDTLSYLWRLNSDSIGDGSGSSSSYLYKTGYVSAGMDTITVYISDGLEFIVKQWIVTVNNLSLPPQITAPYDGQIMTGDSTLAWLPSADPDLQGMAYYRVELTIDSTFSTITAFSDSIIGTYLILDSAEQIDLLPPDQNIYWRVQAFDTAGYATDFTDGSNFFFYPGNPISMSGILPAQAYVSQNIPNPFRHSTVIPFGVPQIRGRSIQKVHIDIFSPSGRLMESYQQAYAPGCYFFDWGRTASSGMYMLRIRIGDSFQRTLTVQKAK